VESEILEDTVTPKGSRSRVHIWPHLTISTSQAMEALPLLYNMDSAYQNLGDRGVFTPLFPEATPIGDLNSGEVGDLNSTLLCNCIVFGCS
jgi:hypothetical protein